MNWQQICPLAVIVLLASRMLSKRRHAFYFKKRKEKEKSLGKKNAWRIPLTLSVEDVAIHRAIDVKNSFRAPADRQVRGLFFPTIQNTLILFLPGCGIEPHPLASSLAAPPASSPNAPRKL